MSTCQADGLVVQRTQTTPSALGHPGHQTWHCVISSCGVSSKTKFTSHHFQRQYQNCESGNVTQDMFERVWRNGCIAWTSAVSHEGRASNAFKANMKLQTFLFQMVVTSCISVQYLWKYGFAKSSDNLYEPYTLYSTNKYSCVRPVHTLYISYFTEHNGNDEPHDSSTEKIIPYSI